MRDFSGQDGKQRGSQAYKEARANTSRSSPNNAFNTDDRAQRRRYRQSQDYFLKREHSPGAPSRP
jgi:hypothetical protein